MQKRIKAWPGKPGEAWRITYQPDNPNNRVVHIRAIVDGDAIVCAVHSPRRGWRHVIEYRGLFDLMFERGELKRSRAKFPESQPETVLYSEVWSLWIRMSPEHQSAMWRQKTPDKLNEYP